ncbi:hypothetical protein Forpe1208_v006335 [Fusarium oxysporum f. sp. rapae]|uniref:Uncharacterized protein n=1 Tax=Fusarium oxysporum f. sp. rapae TaxID=485398 RepID=A0A8J5U9H6_FUSOX|nr:hypothetical protein Forpe1208_v006335 [Fusarium oxysporum f. sp. rapae]
MVCKDETWSPPAPKREVSRPLRAQTSFLIPSPPSYKLDFLSLDETLSTIITSPHLARTEHLALSREHLLPIHLLFSFPYFQL